MKSTLSPLIINLALTGMVPTKADTPHVPITPREIAATALRCAALGASIVHIHPRDKSGKPTWERSAFEEIIGRIREKNSEVLISVTTSGRNWSEFEKRSACLESTGNLKPDLASLTVGSLNFIRSASVNSPEMIRELALKMKANNIKPELEIFEPGMIHMAKVLIEKDIISAEKPYFNILLGSLGTAPFETSVLSTCLALLPQQAVWSIAGIGQFQLDANTAGLALGGHVRVGLEDNIFFDREKQVLAKNEALVKRIVALSQLLQRPIATPSQARTMLNIPSI